MQVENNKWIASCVLAMIVSVGVTGCGESQEEKDKEAIQASYRINAEAARQCRASLEGMKWVPIIGSHGTRFLDAERLPSWGVGVSVSHPQPIKECGAAGIESEIFYWTGTEIIPQALWLKHGHRLVERPGPQDWHAILLDNVGFGLPFACNGTTDGCIEALAAERERRKALYGNPNRKTKTIQLANYPFDVVLPVNWKDNPPRDSASIKFRHWRRLDGSDRWLSCPAGVFRGMSDSEIENIVFDRSNSEACQLEYEDFYFKWGIATIPISLRELEVASPALQAATKYIEDSIIEKKENEQ